MNARATSDGPWAWVSKRAIRAIGDACDESGVKQASALLVYLSLCVASSDANGNGSFSCPVGLIARKAGLSVRTVHSVLPLLESLRVVHILRTRSSTYMKEPNVYTLLPESDMLWTCFDKPRRIIDGVQNAAEGRGDAQPLHIDMQPDDFA